MAEDGTSGISRANRINMNHITDPWRRLFNHNGIGKCAAIHSVGGDVIGCRSQTRQTEVAIKGLVVKQVVRGMHRIC